MIKKKEVVTAATSFLRVLDMTRVFQFGNAIIAFPVSQMHLIVLKIFLNK